MNPTGYAASRAILEPRGKLAGETAAYHLRMGRHFVAENPKAVPIQRILVSHPFSSVPTPRRLRKSAQV